MLQFIMGFGEIEVDGLFAAELFHPVCKPDQVFPFTQVHTEVCELFNHCQVVGLCPFHCQEFFPCFHIAVHFLQYGGEINQH